MEPISNIRTVHSGCGIFKPTSQEFNNLEKDDYVKVLDNNERFWCEIISKNENKLIVRVDNDLIEFHEFKFNDIIEIERDDIIGILKKGD